MNAIRVPDGADDAAARKHLLERFNLEVGAGLGPLAGKIVRVGLMGASSTPGLVSLFLEAIGDALHAQKVGVSPSAGTAAALALLRD